MDIRIPYQNRLRPQSKSKTLDGSQHRLIEFNGHVWLAKAEPAPAEPALAEPV